MFLKYLSATVVWSTVIVYLCTIPGDTFSDSIFSKIPYFDKAVHLGLYFVLSILMFWSLYRQKSSLRLKYNAALITFWYGIILGLLIEVIQGNFVESRTFETIDWLSDSIGCIAGLLLAERMFFRIKTG